MRTYGIVSSNNSFYVHKLDGLAECIGRDHPHNEFSICYRLSGLSITDKLGLLGMRSSSGGNNNPTLIIRDRTRGWVTFHNCYIRKTNKKMGSDLLLSPSTTGWISDGDKLLEYKLLEERFASGWSRESLANICLVLELSRYDLIQNMSIEFCDWVGIVL